MIRDDPGWDAAAVWSQHPGHGVPCPAGSAAWGRELGKSGHSALAQPAWKVCRAPPELVLLPARESLTFIKAKFTLTF